MHVGTYLHARLGRSRRNLQVRPNLGRQPEVHDLFLQNVPHKVSMSEFWHHYFRSKRKHEAAPVHPDAVGGVS